jgi:hypothetical protein
MRSRKNLRIAMFFSSNPSSTGGVQEHVLYLSRQLRKMGHSVTIFGPEGKSSMYQDYRTIGYTIQLPLRTAKGKRQMTNPSRMSTTSQPGSLSHHYRHPTSRSAWAYPAKHAQSEHVPFRVGQRFGRQRDKQRASHVQGKILREHAGSYFRLPDNQKEMERPLHEKRIPARDIQCG